MNKKFIFKILTITGLIIGLLIPLSMIESVVSDRSYYRYEAKRSIADSWTGSQKFLGPVLVIPYKQSYIEKKWDKNLEKYVSKTLYNHKKLILLPEKLIVHSNITTEERKRGLYSQPVYSSELRVQGVFDNGLVQELYQQKGSGIKWKKPYLTVAVSDIRGITQQPELFWQGKNYEFASGSNLSDLGAGMHAKLPLIDKTKQTSYEFSFSVKLNGMESIEFSPVGKNTQVNLLANWPHPSFIGRYLPEQKDIQETMFSAKWNMSSFSSDMPSVMSTCQEGNCAAFKNNTFGVALINTVDIYQKTERSIKYAILFICLTFIVFFLYEIMKNMRLHPMQYMLVGLSLTFFYLLLVSLSEHMAFASAYLISTVSNIGVITIYISEVLKSRKRAFGFSGMLSVLYAMLYAILISEDNALLMGSLLFFAILSLVMIVTRKIDWYKVTEDIADQVVLKNSSAETT